MMALTKDFKDTIQARAQRDSAFRKALLQEGVECLLAGDVDTGKAVLRDYINATIGFEELSGLRQIEQEPHAYVRAKRESPGEQPVCGDPLPAGAGGDTPGSQSPESGLRSAVWQRSIGNFSEHFEGFSEHGILICPGNNQLIIKGKNGSFTIEWE